MKTIKLLLLLLTVALASCGNPKPETTATPETPETVQDEREFYQLKIYSFSSEDQIAATDNYLKNAFIPAVKKQGIDKVGVFKFRTNETDTVQKTYVLLPLKGLQQFTELDNKLLEDEEYTAAGNAYINSNYDNPPYDRIQSILMRSFHDMPKMKTPNLDSPRSERVYELRSYESATEKYYRNKVDMFNAGGEIPLFDRLGFNAVFYGEVLSGANMPNLMYMTTHNDMATREKNWEAFVNAPEWKELIAMPKYENNVSHADIWFLYPTEYSDY
ncbi:NIPSNAP family protein [Flagellimonas halotolerans]|uniref:NIPSNAP family protein n=1 Tax=Flagellimonas halotolerans TaxID=3112164 RepID=A0ABU6IMG2_9FLAO|nr:MULTISPECIES: NIPSNAP family protein [unclassified Allomuricauda]MEC3964393.1 NIPSNAP family protein [Muricauda sp. SYSU M86414]MEC4264263.1 NIPSNAP family protein [Muricauda sp. SYSU M84420]